MAKKLEIVGLFNNSQIRRAFGDMIADTSKAKTTWSEMVTKMKSGEKEISAAIQDNIKQIKEKERAITALNSKMNNPLNSSWNSKYQQQITYIDKTVASLKRQNAELERTARYEKTMTFKTIAGGAIGSTMRAGGVVAGAALTAGAAIMGNAYRNYMPVDQQIGLLDATLRPKTGATKEQVKGQIFGTSTKYGKDAAEVAASYTQLFSSGMMPTATEGTAEYTKQMDEAGRVLDEVAKASAATGESMTSMQSALVYTANAFGRDIHSVTDVKEVLDAMGTTLDLGIGTMSQYTSEFSKFSPAAKIAGASMKESMAVFALMTQSYGSAEAGHATKQFFEESGNSARYMSRAQNVLARMGKGGLVVGTDSDKDILGKFAAKGTGAKALNDYFVDAKGNNKPLTETLKEVNATYKKLNSDSAKNAFISAIGAMNANMVKTWRVMTGDAMVNENGEMVKGTGVDKLTNFIEQYEKTGVMDAKIAQVQEHMSFKMQQLGQTWSNGLYGFIGNAEPAITELLDFLTMIAGQLPALGKAYQEFADGVLAPIGTQLYDFIHSEEITAGNNGDALGKTTSGIVAMGKASNGQEATQVFDKMVDAAEAFNIHGMKTYGTSAFWSLANGPMRDAYKTAGLDYGLTQAMSPWKWDEHTDTARGKILSGRDANLLQLLNEFGGDENKTKDFLGKARAAAVANSPNGGDPNAINSIDGALKMIDQLVQADQMKNGTIAKELSVQTGLLQIIAHKDFSFSSPIAAFLGGLGSGGKDVKPGATPVVTK